MQKSPSSSSVHVHVQPSQFCVVDDSDFHFGANDVQLQDRDRERDRDRTCTNSLTSRGMDSASATRDVKERPASPPPAAALPFRARFWDKDPDTAVRRKKYFVVVGGGTFLMILAIFAILSIFWGSLYRVQYYAHKLEGWVVDFDGGPIGQTVIETFQNNTGEPQQLTWRVVDASQFPNGLPDIEEAVVQEKAWVAVTINKGASTNLSAAIASADSSYDGSRAVTSFVDEARNENGYSSFIQPIMIVPLADAAQVFALQNSRQLSANTSVDVETLLARAPNVITQPIYYTINNLRPFDAPVAQAVDFVGLIYLLIISFVICMMNYQGRVIVSGLNRHLQLKSLLLMRMIIPIVLYFFVSVFFSMLSLAFQAPFNRVFGGWGFVIYWMMNWMGMCAMGLAMEAMITILTPAFTPFFLIIWIISNVSVASVPIEVLPGVFKYGYAMPFYNVSRAVRTILFNTRNQIGLNFGVQIAWIAISLITMPLFTILMRKKEERAWARQQQEAASADPKEEV